MVTLSKSILEVIEKTERRCEKIQENANRIKDERTSVLIAMLSIEIQSVCNALRALIPNL